MHPIVRVHARDDRAETKRDSRIEGRDKAGMGSGMDANARVLAREVVSDFEGSVCRSVIDEDAFPADAPLANDTL